MCQTFGKHFVLFFFFADNFTGLKDTEPYKTDVSFLCQYTIKTANNKDADQTARIGQADQRLCCSHMS